MHFTIISWHVSLVVEKYSTRDAVSGIAVVIVCGKPATMDMCYGQVHGVFSWVS